MNILKKTFPDNIQQYQVFGTKFVTFNNRILTPNWDQIGIGFVTMSNDVFPVRIRQNLLSNTTIMIYHISIQQSSINKV